MSVSITINEGTFSNEPWEKLKLIDNFFYDEIYIITMAQSKCQRTLRMIF